MPFINKHRSDCVEGVTLGLLLLIFVLHAIPAAAQQPPRLRGLVVSSNITEEDVSDLAKWKVKVVRYIFAFPRNADYATEDEYAEMLEDAMTAFDEKLPLFERYGIRVILNLHSSPGGYKTHDTPAWHRLFCEAWTQRAFIDAWKKIAEHYAASRTVIAFDILNEPAERKVSAGLKNWNALAAEAVSVIRSVDSAHTIIIESAYGTPGRLLTMELIKAPNIIYSFHTYSYAPFRLQGFGGRPINVSYPTKKFDKASIVRSLQNARSFQRRRGAKIYVGEFSAVRWAPKGSAFRYLRDVLQIFESNKWSWTYHAFRESDPWSVEHDSNPKNHSRTTTPTDREVLLKKYLQK